MTKPLLGMRVLLVDDEPLVRNVFRRWLLRQGMEVHEAASVAAGCDLLVSLDGQIDVVLTDYRMPGLSGADLIVYVRAHWPAMPVILVSAIPDENVLPVEPDLVVAKPVNGSELGAAIDELFSERRVTERMARLSRAG